MQYYLIVVWSDVGPKLSGPYPEDAARLLAARKHRARAPMAQDGLFRLDINPEIGPRITPFGGHELEGAGDEE